MAYYHTAQICLNGHIITDSYDTNHELAEKFCSKCHAKTITSCPSCGAKIRGNYEVEGVTFLGSTMSTAPAYCYNCGNHYPWTQSALDAANALISEDENLNEDDKKQFKDALPDLLVTSPTPKTKVAAVRFKKFMGTVASFTADGIKDIFTDVASEVIKKSIGL